MTMYIETRPSVPFGAVLSLRVVNFFEDSFAMFITWNTARKTSHILNQLSYRQLEDIGLNPTDIKKVSVNTAGYLN